MKLFFKNKKRQANKNKAVFIARIEKVQLTLSSDSAYKARKYLDGLIDILDNPSLELTESQSNCIKNCLNSIEKHAYKEYEDLLIVKCEQIKSALIRPELAYSIDENAAQNEDVLFEKLGELSSFEKEIADLTQKRDSMLGKDQFQWQLYNSKIQDVTYKMNITKRSYNNLLKAQLNASLVKTIEQAKDEAVRLTETTAQIDIPSVSDDVGVIQEVTDDIETTGTSITDICSTVFPSTNEDSEYQQALAASELGTSTGEMAVEALQIKEEK